MNKGVDMVRWGITGTGKIADIYANMIRSLPDMEVYGVTARDRARTEAFRASHGIRKAYPSLEEMIADGEVDCVFVGTPHTVHKEQVKLLVDAGIPVLCTKPMSTSKEDILELFAYAAQKGVMLWESMWHLFKPTITKARQLLSDGAIGRILKIEIHCSFIAEFDPKNRLFNQKLGGGALLDVGIYAVSICHFLMKERPAAVKAFARVGATGCDEITEILLQYPDGTLAYLESGIIDEERQEVRIVGTEGTLVIDDFWYADHLMITRRDGMAPKESDAGSGAEACTGSDAEAGKCFDVTIRTEDHTESWTSERHDYQLMQFAACVREGAKRQSTKLWTPEDSAAIYEIMDEVFNQVGIDFSNI